MAGIPAFPIIARVARNILGMPAGTVDVERLFSLAGRVTAPRRSRLTPEHINQLTLLAAWLREDEEVAEAALELVRTRTVASVVEEAEVIDDEAGGAPEAQDDAEEVEAGAGAGAGASAEPPDEVM